MQASDEPFAMSFGRLKRLLMDEEVVGADCKDTEIREHIEAQLHDDSVKDMPLKYQMAWLVQELDLHHSSEQQSSSARGNKAAVPSTSSKRASPRGTTTPTTTTRNPLRKSGSWSNSSTSSGGPRGRSVSSPRSEASGPSSSKRSSSSSSSSKNRPSAGGGGGGSSGRSPPSARMVGGKANNSGSSSSSGYGKDSSSSSPRTFKVTPGRNSTTTATSSRSSSQARAGAAAGAGMTAAAGGKKSAARGAWGAGFEKKGGVSRRGSANSTNSSSGGTRTTSGVSEAESSDTLSEADVATVARQVAGGVLMGTYEVLDVSGLSPADASPLVWHRMGEVMKREGQQRAMELFRRFDKDKNGYIDPKEFRQALVLMSCTGHTDGMAEGIVALADTMGGGGDGGGSGSGSNRQRGGVVAKKKKSAGFGRGAQGVQGPDGRLEYKEVIEAMRQAQLSSAVAWRRVLAFLRESPEGARSLEAMFSSMDGNGDRSLDKSELAQGMVSIGVDLTDMQVEAFKNDLDANKDGWVSLEEFSSAVEQRSVDTASAEREGWTHVLGSLLLDGIGESNGDGHATARGGGGPGTSPSSIGGGGGEGSGEGEGEEEGGNNNTAEIRMREIQLAFDDADANGDGVLNLAELVQLLLILGVKLSEVQAELLREAMDLNGDGMISRDEFVRVLEQQRSLASDMVWFAFLHFMREKVETAARVEEMFSKCDADGSHSLDVKELSDVLKTLGMELDPLQLHLFHSDLDLNGNGSITLDEFTTAIEHHGAALGGLLDAQQQVEGNGEEEGGGGEVGEGGEGQGRAGEGDIERGGGVDEAGGGEMGGEEEDGETY